MHGLRHHVVPRSIGGPGKQWNIYLWEKGEKHIAWHNLFKNFSPSVCIKIIEGWSDKKGKLNKKIMGNGFLKSWPMVFGKRSPKEAIEFIKREFLPVEKIFIEEISKNT